MVGADVYRHHLGSAVLIRGLGQRFRRAIGWASVATLETPRRASIGLAERCAIHVSLVVGESNRLSAEGKIATLGPADVIVGEQDAGQFGVGAEDDAEEVDRPRALGIRRWGRASTQESISGSLSSPGSASIALTRIRSTRSRFSSS